jgi:hypothetical protein
MIKEKELTNKTISLNMNVSSALVSQWRKRLKLEPKLLETLLDEVEAIDSNDKTLAMLVD